MADIDDDLIFDIGMHHGDDTAFYLAKGFRVVAVEADPKLVRQVSERLAGPIAEGRLVIVGSAIWEAGGTEIPFFIHGNSDRGWSSAFQASAERDGSTAEAIRVPTTTVSELFDRHGVPRYLKCDIEGGDAVVVRQLAEDGRLPTFVSVEISGRGFIERLAEMGYDRFQLVNQALLHRTKLAPPPREGRFAPLSVGGHASGPFGLDLPAAFWAPAPATLRRYDDRQRHHERRSLRGQLMKRVSRLTGRGWLSYRGWMDVHATTAAALARPHRTTPSQGTLPPDGPIGSR
ncbi:MAG: FkbM family methyltransferase [Azospirillaceae bacterium]